MLLFLVFFSAGRLHHVWRHALFLSECKLERSRLPRLRNAWNKGHANDNCFTVLFSNFLATFYKLTSDYSNIITAKLNWCMCSIVFGRENYLWSSYVCLNPGSVMCLPVGPTQWAIVWPLVSLYSHQSCVFAIAVKVYKMWKHVRVHLRILYLFLHFCTFAFYTSPTMSCDRSLVRSVICPKGRLSEMWLCRFLNLMLNLTLTLALTLTQTLNLTRTLTLT